MTTLKVYFTSDLHGHLWPTDYTDRQVKDMGLLAIAESIHKDGNTLVIDGGDTIQGSPLATYVAGKSLPIHPMAAVMNQVGYDFITLGNHDFNYGQAFLTSYLDGIEAKVLCGNVRSLEENTWAKDRQLMPYDVKVMENGLKVGIVGMTTDFINVWEKAAHIEGLQITDGFEAAKKGCEALRDSVDVLIGVYHGGFENDLNTHEAHAHTTENQAFRIAKTLDFDLLLTGHQHMAIVSQTLFDTHIVQTPANGAQFAEITITVDDDGVTAESQLKNPQGTSVDPTKAPEGLREIEAEVQAWLDGHIGHLDVPMVVTDHMTMALKGNYIVNFMNQVQLDATGADISCASLANKVLGLGQEVTLRDVLATYIYPNTQMVLEVSGEVLRKALERCAAYFDAKEGVPVFSDSFMKPKMAHYNYDYFSGIYYTFDLTKPMGSRVTEVTHQGKEVRDSDVFKLAMNNYRATGTGGYEFFRDCPVVADIQVATSEMIAQYFRKHPVVTVDKEVYHRIVR